MSQELLAPGSSVPSGPYAYPHPEGETREPDALKRILFILFKWKNLIGGLFLAFTVAAGIAVLMKPAVHTAKAKILLKGDRTPLHISGLSPETSRIPYVPQALQSEIELVQSREVLAPVAGNMMGAPQGNGSPSQEAEIEDRIDSLSKKVAAVALPDTNVIEVTYFGSSPRQARDTLQMIIDEYFEHHATAYSGSDKLLKFYEGEVQRVGSQLQSAEERLKQTSEESNIASVDEQITNQIHLLGDRSRALQQVEAEMATIRDRDPLVEKIRGELVTAEIALQDLLQRYTEKDRRVREKKAQILLIKRKLSAAENAALASVSTQRGKLRQQLQNGASGLATLRAKKVEIDRLSRQVELSRESYMLYGKHLEEARIAAGLDREQLSNVALIERPYATYDGDLKKRVGFVLLASIVGLVLGMAIAVGVEFFSNTVRTREDAEYYLGSPVLAVIPDVRRGQPRLTH